MRTLELNGTQARFLVRRTADATCLCVLVSPGRLRCGIGHAGMDVEQLVPGLWRWTGQPGGWGDDVGSTYYETVDGVCLIDPLVPPAAPEVFLEALDRDVDRLGGRVHVLLTVFWHARSARELVERYGACLWAPSRARAAAERRTGPVDMAFRPGDGLPGDLQALAAGRGGEVVFWLPAARTLVVGDVMLGQGEGGLRLCPESWLATGWTHARLRRALRPLLGLPVERVLVSHGEPVRDGGALALRMLLDEPVPAGR
jgi:glyoxylase-like metal-dependent hydrolase (beta-lactamase superfamily II)